MSLVLSRHVLPQVRMGRQVITPVNMIGGADRLAFLDGLVAHLEVLIASRGLPLDALTELVDRVHFAKQLVALTLDGGRLSARKLGGAEDRLRFDASRLSVVLLDGRKRRRDEMLQLDAGEGTPALAALFPALIEGAPRDLLEEHLEAELVDELAGAGVLEAGAHVVPGAAESDRVTWLGHAAAIYESGGTAIWVDPHLAPRMVWRDEDGVFSDAHADAVLFSPYGPACLQRPVAELPRPDAVLITHADVDHFDLGVLMCLPHDATLVVPKVVPGRPWDVDLAQVIRAVLGPERPVVALGHGEQAAFEGITVEALPFVGEYPPSLPHTWNTYVVGTQRSAAAFLADSAVGSEQAARLASLLGGRRSVIFGRACLDPRADFGWRENKADAYGSVRLWPWYAPLAGWFDPTPPLGPTQDDLRQLAAAGVEMVFPYASGAAPWFRFHSPEHPFYAGIGSLSRAELERFEAVAREAGMRVPEIRYGVPFEL